MKIEKISYQKLFPLGAFINEKIGVEMQLDEGDNPVQVLNEAKKLVEKYHIDTNPQMYIDDVPQISTTTTIDQVQPLTKVASLIQQINSCEEIKVLESYKLIVKTDPDLQRAYDKKLKQLQ